MITHLQQSLQKVEALSAVQQEQLAQILDDFLESNFPFKEV